MSSDNLPIEILISERRFDEAYDRMRGSTLDGRQTLLFGQAAWATGHYSEAVEAFSAADTALPASEEAATKYAQALLGLGRSLDARDQLERALLRLPRSVRLRYMHLRLAIDANGIAASGRGIEELVALEPNAAEPRMLQKASALLAGKAPAASEIFEMPALNAAWDGFLFQAAHTSARLFGTSNALLRYALGVAPFEGLTLEFGVYHGLSLAVIAEQTRGQVDGFDSFQGLPEAWLPDEAAGSYSTYGRTPDVPANVRLHRGWFADTVPSFVAGAAQMLRFAHIDCDLYSSTKTVLEAIEDKLVSGSVIVFDDFLGFPGAKDHEFRAWQEFVARRQIAFDYLGFVVLGRAAALVIR